MRTTLLKLASIGLLLLLSSPSYAGPKEDSAVCDTDASRPEQAIPACTRLIAAHPKGLNLSILYYNRGLAWHKKGDLEKAKSDYDQSIAIDPTFAPSYGQRGKVLSQNQAQQPFGYGPSRGARTSTLSAPGRMRRNSSPDMTATESHV
jgi:tetratricopeptide (TPR) repeat protein